MFDKSIRILLAGLALAMCATQAPAFTIPWGDVPGQLGLVNQIEVERQGPLTFAVSPAGTIYVADTVHQSIKEFTADGTFVRVVAENVRPTCIAFNDEGNLLLLTGHTVEVRSPRGDLLQTIAVPESVPLIEGYAQEVFGDGALIGVNDPDENVYLFGHDGSPAKAKGRSTAARARVHTAAVGAAQAELRVQPLTGVAPQSAVVKAAEGRRLGAVIFRGQATSGEIVTEVEEIAPDNYVHLKAKKLKPAGGATEIELPNRYFTTVYRKFQSLPDGTLWQMQTKPEGVEFTQRSLAQ